MTVGSLFMLVLNLANFAIMPWFLFHAYRQYKFTKGIEDKIAVYDPSMLIPHKALLAAIMLYVAAVTILWGLHLFGFSNRIEEHWFAYVYMLVIPLGLNHNRVHMLIGKNGISAGSTLIPLGQISRYELREYNPTTSRLALEIHTGNTIMRGVLPRESRQTLENLLDNRT